MTKEELLAIQFYRSALGEKQEEEDGTLECAKRLADKHAKMYGISTSVIRKNNKYFWVTEYYFDTYEYKGKIYYKADAEV